MGGAHFLSPSAQESHHLSLAEAEKVGRLRVGGPEVLIYVHRLLGEGPAGTPGSALPGKGWHGGFGLMGQAGGRWMPMAPVPAEGQLGQVPVGRLGNLLSAEQNEPGRWLESQGKGTEGHAGESGQWPRWR